MIPATELDAVNAMLGAIGQAPLTTLEGTLPTDVQIALNILRRTTTEVQAKGWRFNSEFGYELTPSGTFVWPDTAFLNHTLNIFTPPANLLSFTTTKSVWQQGDYFVDTEIRPSRLYKVNNAPVLVFYDREMNRDGFANRPYLYINPVWAFAFGEMPVSARSYVLIRASRRYQQQVAGSPDSAGITAYDEQQAERALLKEQGHKDDHNAFRNRGVARVFGNRPFGAGGAFDFRSSPGTR
jgi:hypothetical protein